MAGFRVLYNFSHVKNVISENQNLSNISYTKYTMKKIIVPSHSFVSETTIFQTNQHLDDVPA